MRSRYTIIGSRLSDDKVVIVARRTVFRTFGALAVFLLDGCFRLMYRQPADSSSAAAGLLHLLASSVSGSGSAVYRYQPRYFSLSGHRGFSAGIGGGRLFDFGLCSRGVRLSLILGRFIFVGFCGVSVAYTLLRSHYRSVNGRDVGALTFPVGSSSILQALVAAAVQKAAQGSLAASRPASSGRSGCPLPPPGTDTAVKMASLLRAISRHALTGGRLQWYEGNAR